MTEIKAMFGGLFAALYNNSLLAAPVITVEHSPIPQVFLVWESPSSGFDKVTDTFLFDDAGKIIRQNIVVQTAPTTQPAWDNHFAAFGGQNLDQIMLDYTEDSVIFVHDIATGTNSKHAGMTEVRAMFDGLFAELSDLSELSAPIVKVEEGPVPQVFFVWSCPSSGITQATDTFAFDGADKIIRRSFVAGV